MNSDLARISDLMRIVPSPLGEPLPVGISDDDIKGFEHRTNLQLPDDFKAWLRLTNGPCIGPGGFHGINPLRHELDIEYHYELRPVWQRLQWIPVAGDGCGNYYLIVTTQEFGKGNPIIFIDTMNGDETPTFVIASSFLVFARLILEKELEAAKDNYDYDFPWPFDEAYTTTHDPEIVKFKGVPLPWQA